MKQIKLGNKNKYALVDDDNFDFLIGMGCWYADKSLHTEYVRSYKAGNPKMHRIIMEAKKGQIVDHINGNGLDNRKENLRFVTHSQNSMNAGISNKRFKGVCFEDRKGRPSCYRCYLTKNYKRYFVGYFKTAEEAAMAYNVKAKELFGEFARFNNI